MKRSALGIVAIGKYANQFQDLALITSNAYGEETPVVVVSQGHIGFVGVPSHYVFPISAFDDSTGLARFLWSVPFIVVMDRDPADLRWAGGVMRSIVNLAKRVIFTSADMHAKYTKTFPHVRFGIHWDKIGFFDFDVFGMVDFAGLVVGPFLGRSVNFEPLSSGGIDDATDLSNVSGEDEEEIQGDIVGPNDDGPGQGLWADGDRIGGDDLETST